jgi:hypothetical protein
MPLPPPSPENKAVLDAAKVWFEEKIIASHVRNTMMLSDVDKFNINPFTVWYLAKFTDNEVTPRSIAKALILPRALGSSIATSLGTNLQRFITDTLVTAYGSAASGMDIDFKDRRDGLNKYSQLKLGPNTINKDDVKTINDKFKGVQNLLKANGQSLSKSHFAVGIMFGEESEVNSWYRELRDEHGWELYVGKDFWWRLTGDEDFLDRLVDVIQNSTESSAASTALESTIQNLSKDPRIQKLAFEFNKGV